MEHNFTSDQKALLLIKYNEDYENRKKPVDLSFQIEVYASYGYIEYGHNGEDEEGNRKYFPTFDLWVSLERNKELVKECS